MDDEIVASLHHLGLTTIGQIIKLPRESLPARFGSQLLLRIDQAFDRIAEPLVPLEPFSPISARMDFDGSVESLEAIWMVFKSLLKTIVADLLKRGCGALRDRRGSSALCGHAAQIDPVISSES